jgi:hypothetical protein
LSIYSLQTTPKERLNSIVRKYQRKHASQERGYTDSIAAVINGGGPQVDSPDNDGVKGAGCIGTGLAGHNLFSPSIENYVNLSLSSPTASKEGTGLAHEPVRAMKTG